MGGCESSVEGDTAGLGAPSVYSLTNYGVTIGSDCVIGAFGIPGGLHQIVTTPIENAIPGTTGKAIGGGVAGAAGGALTGGAAILLGCVPAAVFAGVGYLGCVGTFMVGGIVVGAAAGGITGAITESQS